MVGLLPASTRAVPGDLVAAYSFDEGSGTSVGDASGLGNVGVVEGASWSAAGKNGGALSFNGSSARVRVADSAALDVSSALTVMAWVFPAVSQSGWRTLVEKEDAVYFLHASSQAGALRSAGGGQFGSTDAWVSAPAGNALPVGVWSHVALTFDGSQLRLFVNGVQRASAARSGALAVSSSPLWIGGNSPYGEYFNGRIDDVRVYRSALSESEIQTDMATPVGGVAPPDTSPPSAPGSPVASAVGSDRIDVSWSAATDDRGVASYDVERCQGVGCSSFAPLRTVTTTSLSDTGLAAGTSFSYRVRARDTSGNVGAYSTVVSATTGAAPPPPDTSPPSAPGSPVASAVGSDRIDVSWSAATDDRGVASYDVERCQGVGCSSFAPLRTVTTTSLSDTGLAAGTSFSYRVRARDTSGNVGAYSTVVSATTGAAPPPPDTSPPSAPGSPVASAVGSDRIDVSWSAATDDRGVASYDVERCQGVGCSSFAPLRTVTTTSLSDTGLAAGTSFSYRVRARDTSGNVGAYSTVVSATTGGSPPPPPSGTLVAAYSFDEGSGTSVGDASGLGNVGVVEGASWSAAGKNGGALSFNGSSARVRVADSAALDVSSALTVMAWVFPAVSQSGWRTLVEKEGAVYFLHASSQAGALRSAGGGRFGSTDAWVTAPNANKLPVGVWSHVALTFDGSQLRLFVNGVQRASAARSGALAVSSSPLWIGGNSPYGEYFNGRIDDVRVYRSALSATELQADMARPAGPPTPPPPPPQTPKLTITAPAAGATVAGGTVNITYTTSGDLAAAGVDHVHFYLDGGPEKMDLTLDGSYVYSGVHVGSHALEGWLVRADHTKIAGTEATPVQFTNVVDPADPVSPSVNVVAPADGASVAGQVQVSADAADNIGVYGVQLKLDGASLGSEDLASPYAVTWDTTSSSAGAHVLTAVARDAAGNKTTSSPVTVTAANAGPDPAVLGRWSTPGNLPIVPIHTNMLPNGKILIFDSSTFSSSNPRVWDPATGSVVAAPYDGSTNLFCSAHTPLPDGRILVVGGHISNWVGTKTTTIFDPATNRWTDVRDMTYGRWYPTVTKLPDGRMLAVSGAINCPDCGDPNAAHNGIADLPEIYDPATNTWSVLTGASLRLPMYPHMYVLPDGRVFAASTATEPIASRVLDLGTRTWSVVDPAVRDGGASAMYLPGKILKSGTAWEPDYPIHNSTAEAWVIDMAQPSPTWRQVQPMAFPRTQHQLTVLPDGSVLATGGSRNSDVNDRASAVLPAELWNPETERWTTLASGVVPRLYHSMAVLMSDGRVALGGGGHPPGFGVEELRSEIYSPPYLFKGPRPTISSAPSTAGYGQSFFVATPNGAEIAKVALIPQPTVTHAVNMNAGYVPLTFTQTSGGLTVSSPANGNLAPPGMYMLFLVDGNGIPSVASWIRVSASGQAQALEAASTGALGAAQLLSWPWAPGSVGGALFQSPYATGAPAGAGTATRRPSIAERKLVCTIRTPPTPVVTARENRGPPADNGPPRGPDI